MNSQTKQQLLQKVAQQHRIIMELQAENEALKADLAKPDRLQNVQSMLDVVEAKRPAFLAPSVKFCSDESGIFYTGVILEESQQQKFLFSNIERFNEIVKEYTNEPALPRLHPNFPTPKRRPIYRCF